MLYRPLLVLHRFSATLFDALIARTILYTNLSRQVPVNVVERLHTYYPAFVGGMDVV